MVSRSRTDRWRLHVALAIGLTICLVGFAVELHRGLGGNLPAWVYVAEWPIFAIVGAVMWWRLLHEDAAADSEPSPAPSTASTAPETEDRELEAWRSYVARLEAGGQPDRE
jgi:hypothetical protein